MGLHLSAVSFHGVAFAESALLAWMRGVPPQILSYRRLKQALQGWSFVRIVFKIILRCVS